MHEHHRQEKETNFDGGHDAADKWGDKYQDAEKVDDLFRNNEETTTAAGVHLRTASDDFENSVSPSSFEVLDADDDVAFIDDEIVVDVGSEVDCCKSDSSNWLMLYDHEGGTSADVAPKQSQDDIDL